ncbi:hypothetical protein FisN_27Lu129 [Fistulifera solaris]|uniref:Uncharacterized protein n=1 Tax=Fistulifera solaris TaxID=1519565 RepID=A0A1Z5KAY4_FISSO|nr:hypothetical protein FisN_27Lu129 [Fistulifera solaris]|eukprot:GAX23315.1 hypothetical protein FisN_27Lu129 [Fistulifera solaris]
MPKIIGKSQRVVDVEGILSIDEYVGNVGSHSDDISIAVVQVQQPSSEPWLTLQYDEWMVVLKEHLEIHYQADNEIQIMTVSEGETVFIPKGERFRPVFPQSGATYVPVCIPAFRPDRCFREEEGTSDISTKLAERHAKNEPTVSTTPPTAVYHMCPKALWDEAVSSGKAYFPPTFAEDGYFTHATALPDRLLPTANHFYAATEGEWVCLELSTTALLDAGIVTKMEEPKPVGAKSVSENWVISKWACPHIYGGIPTRAPGVVLQTYTVERDEKGTLLSILGLMDR